MQALAGNHVLHAVKIKHSFPFSGGSITASVSWLSATGGVYTSASFDVFQATGDTVFLAEEPPTLQKFTTNAVTGTNVNISATATGGNLNTLTAGSVDVWILASRTN